MREGRGVFNSLWGLIAALLNEVECIFHLGKMRITNLINLGKNGFKVSPDLRESIGSKKLDFWEERFIKNLIHILLSKLFKLSKLIHRKI